MNKTEIKELDRFIDVIADKAYEFGLRPFDTRFHLVPAEIMYEYGAYGLPGRFSHWTHGKAYYKMKTMYDYGLSKIYELVINTDPSHAFLLENNDLLQNKVVAAHALGHTDFFKNNIWFENTNRRMDSIATQHSQRIDSYVYKYGIDEVEKFMDNVLSIESHIDHSTVELELLQRKTGKEREKEEETRTSQFDDIWNMGKVKEDAKKEYEKFPPEPVKDLLWFIANYADDLEEWQRDVMHIIRDEMRYFLPQMQTKIMNEGWAAYWHTKIMNELFENMDEAFNFAKMNSRVLLPPRTSINPYLMGKKIFEGIEKRWDEPNEEDRKRNPGMVGGQGRQKIFEVREEHNDDSFLRTFLTKELVDELDLYIYNQEWAHLVAREKGWEIIRDRILKERVNYGEPLIVIEDADYGLSRELYLKHQYEDQELDRVYAEKTLKAIRRLWGRIVHLETTINNQLYQYTCGKDGSITLNKI